MSAVLVAVLALGAPPAVAESGGSPAPAVEVRSPREFRAHVTATLKRTASLSATDPEQSARELLSLAAELWQDKGLARPDRKRYLRIVRGRLRTLSETLSAHLEDGLPSTADRATGEDAATGVAADDGAAGGGRVRDNGRELVELIQRTIAPETWDVNGGEGVIIYYEPLRVLVIRQTAEVHGDVGGVLDGVRGE